MRSVSKWMLGHRGHRGCRVCGARRTAQSWPTQRVTIVVPFGAGSVTDIMARILADDLAKRWNQQVIVENRPGIAGTAARAKAAPDGHTLLLTSNGHTVANLVSKTAPFDAVADFAGITRVCNGSALPDLPSGNAGQDPKEVIALAKEKPGTLELLLAGSRQHHVHRGRAVPQQRPASTSSTCPTRARRMR